MTLQPALRSPWRLAPFAFALITCSVLVGRASAATTSQGPYFVQGAKAIAWLNQQRGANAIPSVTNVDQAFATAWCPDLANGPSGGETYRAMSPIAGWDATTSPWDGNQLSQYEIYDPLLTAAGDVYSGNPPISGDECLGIGAPEPEPSSPTFYAWVADDGPGEVPATGGGETVTPPSVQQVAGIPPQQTTGPQPILYALGLPGETLYNGSPHAVSATLTTVAGASVPNVRMVDSAAVTAYGYPGYLQNGGVMVPPPLTPNTTYHGSVLWQAMNGSTYTQTFTFHTLSRHPALKVGLDSYGGAGVEIASESAASTLIKLTSPRTHHVVWSTRTRPGTLRLPRWIPIPSSLHGRYELCAEQGSAGVYTAGSTCAGLVRANHLATTGDWGIAAIDARVSHGRLHLKLFSDKQYRGVRFSYRSCALAPGKIYGPCRGRFRTTRLQAVLRLSVSLPVSSARVEVDYKASGGIGHVYWAWAA